jgi:hypothetical protein
VPNLTGFLTIQAPSLELRRSVDHQRGELDLSTELTTGILIRLDRTKPYLQRIVHMPLVITLTGLPPKTSHLLNAILRIRRMAAPIH